MKKLQKHQAFTAELAAHEGRIQKIRDKGETMLQDACYVLLDHMESTKIWINTKNRKR